MSHRNNVFWHPVFQHVFWCHCLIFHANSSLSCLLFCDLLLFWHEVILNAAHIPHGGQQSAFVSHYYGKGWPTWSELPLMAWAKALVMWAWSFIIDCFKKSLGRDVIPNVHVCLHASVPIHGLCFLHCEFSWGLQHGMQMGFCILLYWIWSGNKGQWGSVVVTTTAVEQMGSLCLWDFVVRGWQFIPRNSWHLC